MKIKLLPDDKMKKLHELLSFRQQFELLEYRIIFIAILQMTWKDEPSQMYSIYIQNVFFEDTQYNYENFKKAVFGFHSYEIELKDVKQYSIITQSRGSIKNDSMIEICFHNNIQKFLLDIKTKSTLMTLYNAIFLKQDYAIKLYEVLKKYKDNEPADLDFNDLKELYLIGNQDSENLEKIPNFDLSIIENAVEEINQQCDLYIICEFLKDSQKVHVIVKKNEYFLDGRHIEFKEINDKIPSIHTTDV